MKGRNSVKDICLFQSICILIKLHCSPEFHMIRHFSETEIRYEYGEMVMGSQIWVCKEKYFSTLHSDSAVSEVNVTVEVQYFYNCEKLQELIF